MTEKIIVNAVGYCRISQEDSENPSESLANQEKMIEEFCERHGYSLWRVYIDEYFSGTDRNRPAFNKMMSLKDSKVYDVIVVKDDSRFARDAEFFLKHLRLLGNRKIRLLSVYGEDYTADITTSTFKAGISAHLIEKGRREQRTMMDRKHQERGVYGRPPYGYKKITETDENDKEITRWKIDRRKARKVRSLFERYAAGEKLLDIAKDLEISNSVSYVIIRNPKYIGIFKYSKKDKDFNGKIDTLTKGEYKIKNWKKLIDEETFHKCQEQLDSSASVVRGSREKKRVKNIIVEESKQD